MTRGVFVTGTDTGVGKTQVAVALVSAFARRGLRVAAMKPCETGVGPAPDPNDDAERLRAATGRDLPRPLVCPYRFALPASPEEAARAEGRSVVLDEIVAAYRALAADADLIVVEGAGGLLVPLGPRQTMAELARALALPVVVVARPSLGTVNHTLLTVEAARARGLTVLGVVFSRTRDAAAPDEATNPDAIARHGGVRVLGTLPRLAPGADLGAAAEAHLDLSSLI